MASITKSGKNWRAQIRVVGYPPIYQSFPKKSQAWLWASAAERDLKARQRGEYPKHTVQEALQSFRENEAPNHKGKRWEDSRTLRFESYPVAQKLIGEVGDDDMALWREARLKMRTKAGKPISAGAVRREMVLWGQVFEYAREKLRWIPKNIMRDVRKPSVPRTKPKAVPQDTIDAVVKTLGVAHKSREVALGFLLGCETAMRPWEMVPLGKDQVDYVAQVAHLEKTKNGDDRDVPLSLRAVAIFRELDAMNLDSDTFFTVKEGSVTALFGEARTAAGFPALHFRHSRREGIRRLSKRLEILELARAVGHRDLNSLMIYYQESASSMAKKLDDVQTSPSLSPPSSAGEPPPKNVPAPGSPGDTPP